MKVLIVAKSYNQATSARSIQMQRVIDALRKYTDISIILVTHGNKTENFQSSNFQQFNIDTKQKTYRIKQRVFSGISNFDKDFIRSSVKIIDEIIQNHHIDVLLTVSSPIECHDIGLKINKSNPDLKWISFFSDLWPSHLVPKPLYRNKFGSKADNNFISEIAEICDIIVTPSKYTLDVLRNNIPSIKSKLETINHCSSDLPVSIIEKQLSGFIVHSGFLQKERINEELILAIKELEKHPLFKGLIHIGKYHPKLTNLIKKHDCKKIFLFGSVSEELAGSLQKMCEISMIIEAPMKKISPFLPSKITDSIQFSDKTIFISPERSKLSDMAKEWPGLFVSTYEKNKIINVINKALVSKNTIPVELQIEFSPKTIAEKYINLFKS